MSTKAAVSAAKPKKENWKRGDLLINETGTVIMYLEETVLGFSGVILSPAAGTAFKIGEKQDSFSHSYWIKFTGSVTLTSE